ncbi:cytidylyltransferase domain-containing protein [Acetivibrio clariflavus]|uniref:CMP-N-acetylneuraminic acid synthetase n=1 Tax=Acetivibrio clariflavus (strain DSM 19732 / NBRC 101661 / EBR45) TaxID=720554 RepID=G8LUF9_ACECE|nr:acylneuraminate cytidylyltransferase family protein [Acetivibrio clariflavus]AEV70607.1 CMP-N-acetylneuraminic acid synthetase [Acetivibrio clariflavus DSM 19732]
MDNIGTALLTVNCKERNVIIMKILFTICGRKGSKGVKSKNIKTFLGFPLAFYTASFIDLFIKRNNWVDSDIVLNTDSENLIDLFKNKLNMPIEIIERDPELAKDYVPKISVIKNCYDVMVERKKVSYDIVIDLDITSPLRRLRDLQSLIEKKLNSNADVVFSVTSARRNPYFNMVKKGENGYERVIESSFNARQEAPNVFDINGSMYAYSPDFLKSGKGLFDGICDIIEMRDTAVLDIDHENDFELMEVIAKYLYSSDNEYNCIRENINNILLKD